MSFRGALAPALGMFAAAGAVGCRGAGERELTVGAAASLRVVLPRLLAEFHQGEGGTASPVATYGSSGDLRKQVEGGAPLDVVLAAAAKPVDALVAEGLCERASRRVFATNRLVLVGPPGAGPLGFADLDRLPQGALVAIGEPSSVPVGQYARQALEKLGRWKALEAEARLVYGGDVSQVLAYARRGEVAAAIVYKTDLYGISDAKLLDEARGPWAPRVELVGAVVRGSRHAGRAQALLDFLGTPRAQRILLEVGFGPP